MNGLPALPRLSLLARFALLALAAAPLAAQEAPARRPRILDQDPTLDNLVDPPGCPTARLGELGAVQRSGEGQQAMILVPGHGFGGSVFTDLMASFADGYRMYAVTLAGFGGTDPPPCPGLATSFGEQTWTAAAQAALEKLIEDEHIEQPVLVGHWLGGTQIALRLALKHPGRVRAVVLLAGAARLFSSDPKYAEYFSTPEKRVATVDKYSAPRWFRTVTRETWDDNNFLPGHYAADPVLALRLWRQAASPKLHVWVRYLCEFNAQDITEGLDQLAVRTLLLQPDVASVPSDAEGDVLDGYCRKSWEGRIEHNRYITVQCVPDTRVCPWVDQPQAVHDAMAAFLDGGR